MYTAYYQDGGQINKHLSRKIPILQELFMDSTIIPELWIHWEIWGQELVCPESARFKLLELRKSGDRGEG